ncbi:MAG: fumarate hydratase C-terminal domain-containing protein [Chloroflexi bacterium]|nr:fumarate hydratase C-terminal domain-containing protein [Chloroflexota bacterium]
MTERATRAADLREWHITTPVTPDAVAKLRAGDIVYLTGVVFTARDGVYEHTLKQGHEPPPGLCELTNVTMQSSPAGVEVSPGVYEVASLQATAGFRYAQYMDAFLEKFGVKLVIGKAGMAREVYQSVFQKHGAACLSTMGYGLGAIYGKAVERVRQVYWAKELGISEALWVLEVKELGPLLVEGDTLGNSFFEGANQEINRNLEKLYQGLKQPIFRRLGEEQEPGRELF